MSETPVATWSVLAHGPIEKLADNLWRVTGAVPGMSLTRVMTVVRGASGGLVIHSAIAMQEAAMAELLAWGTPEYLIVPSGFHRLDAPAYKARFPGLRVLAPQGSRKKVEERVVVDGAYADFPSDPHVRFLPLRGINDVEGAMLVESSDGLTLVLNDIVMNMDTRPDLLGRVFTGVMGSAPGPRVSRLSKLLMVKDKKALRAQLEELADTKGLVRLIVAHDKVASGPEARAALRKAASYL